MISENMDFNLNIGRRFPDYGKCFFVFTALFLLLLIIYGNSFHDEWHFDDEQKIMVDSISGVLVKKPEGIPAA